MSSALTPAGLPPDWTIADLIAHHARDKTLLMAHDPGTAAELGRLVARAARMPRGAVERRYAGLREQALALPITHGGHVNALQHLAGHVQAPHSLRGEMVEAIDRYRRGQATLAEAGAVLRRLLGRHGTEWARSQTYLELL